MTAQTTHRCVDNINIQSCNYTLPNGLHVIAQHSKGNAGGNGHTLINSTLTDGFRVSTSTDDMPLLGAGIITFASTNYGGYPTSWNDTMKSFQCNFDLVAYTYSNWTSINGTTNAEALAWSPLKTTANETGSLLVFNATSHDFPESENRTFSVNIIDIESMYSVLANIFQRQSENQFFLQSMYQNALYNSANLTETAQNIAMAMSFRMLQGPNATLVHGSVYEMQTYIHVHWWWLALSVALLLLASALLGTTIALSHEADLKAWKLSLDPLLYGVDTVGIVPLSAENSGISLVEDSQSPKMKTTMQQSRQA